MQWHKVVTIFLSSVVESVCSMLFVLIGCGSTITWPQHETSPNVLSVSMSFGFSCAFLVNISTCFSGGYFNPAITAALAANKSLSAKRALCYVLAQLIGGRNFVFLVLHCFTFNSTIIVNACVVASCETFLWRFQSLLAQFF